MNTIWRVLSVVALGGTLALGACSDDATATPDQGLKGDQGAVDLQSAEGGGDTVVADTSPKADSSLGDLSSADLLKGDIGAKSCTSCHGMPPMVGHHAKHKSYGCVTCHSEVVDANNKIINSALHRNGKKNVKGSFTWNGTGCSNNACHGDKTW